MAKELHEATQGADLVTMSTRAELNKMILGELFYLDTIMQEFYSKFGTMHQAVIHLHERWILFEYQLKGWGEKMVGQSYDHSFEDALREQIEIHLHNILHW